MKYFFGFLASIALIVAVFFLVLRGLTGNSGTETSTGKQLASYVNTSTQMIMYVDGRLNADQEHNAYQITVSRETVTIDTFQGYDQTLLETASYPNTEEGYRQFLGALQRAGFNRGNTDGQPRNPAGVCPAGRTYKMKIVNGASDIQNYWTTSCKGGGSYRGDLETTLYLFRNQVPDYTKLTRGLHL